MRGVGKLAPATQSGKSIVSILSIGVANRSPFLRIARRALCRSRCARRKGPRERIATRQAVAHAAGQVVLSSPPP
jgi:hypothetical protein